MKITILDTTTGKKKKLDTGVLDARWWADGNGNCDCNRSLSFFGYPNKSLGCGNERFLIVKCDKLDKYTLGDMNADYPKELFDKYLGEYSFNVFSK